jgi:hypothetical protein
MRPVILIPLIHVAVLFTAALCGIVDELTHLTVLARLGS